MPVQIICGHGGLKLQITVSNQQDCTLERELIRQFANVGLSLDKCGGAYSSVTGVNIDHWEIGPKPDAEITRSPDPARSPDS